MPTVRVENGIERFVLCDKSDTSDWVTGDAAIAKIKESGMAVYRPDDAMARSLDEMKRAMVEDMQRILAEEKAKHDRQIQISLLDVKLGNAERHMRDLTSEIRRLEGRRAEAMRTIRDLRRSKRELEPTESEPSTPVEPSRRKRKAVADPTPAPKGGHGVAASREELTGLYHMSDAAFKVRKAKYTGKPPGVSGYRGVHSSGSGWAVNSARSGDGRRVSLGSFASKEAAARAFDRYELAEHGVAACLNFHPRLYLTPDGELLPAEQIIVSDGPSASGSSTYETSSSAE